MCQSGCSSRFLGLVHTVSRPAWVPAPHVAPSSTASWQDAVHRARRKQETLSIRGNIVKGFPVHKGSHLNCYTKIQNVYDLTAFGEIYLVRLGNLLSILVFSHLGFLGPLIQRLLRSPHCFKGHSIHSGPKTEKNLFPPFF